MKHKKNFFLYLSIQPKGGKKKNKTTWRTTELKYRIQQMAFQ